jgi:hypothetical protein
MKLFSSGRSKSCWENTFAHAENDRCDGMMPFAPPTPCPTWALDISEVRRIQKNGNSAIRITIRTAR